MYKFRLKANQNSNAHEIATAEHKQLEAGFKDQNKPPTHVLFKFMKTSRSFKSFRVKQAGHFINLESFSILKQNYYTTKRTTVYCGTTKHRKGFQRTERWYAHRKGV